MVKAIARRQGVDPMVIDLDHALGVVLWALTDSEGPRWVFKGGTCLRKAYFEEYRFSEDLDFTVVGRLRVEDVRERMRAIADRSARRGVELLDEGMRIETIDDDYGRESVELLLPYRGALQRRGTPRNVQFHLSADEEVLLGTARQGLLHPYEDAQELECAIECYALEEMLAEKLRAAGGQRTYAVARDVYDVAQLVIRGADTTRALMILPRKAALKGVDMSAAADRFSRRREEYRADWDRSLVYLIGEDAGFDAAFALTAALLERASVGG